MFTKPESRRFPRFDADVRILTNVISEGEVTIVHGRCTSISEGGLGAIMGKEFSPGEVVSLELHIPIVQSPLMVTAVVRNCDRIYHGFEFVVLGAHQRAVINDYSKLLPPSERRRSFHAVVAHPIGASQG